MKYGFYREINDSPLFNICVHYQLSHCRLAQRSRDTSMKYSIVPGPVPAPRKIQSGKTREQHKGLRSVSLMLSSWCFWMSPFSS